ncbi:PRAME family member 5-like [Cavia porcellus]|uniref:PRAME family member 5-like n=1 Tax=Cavia porcellus TaxID=10141 RepID=UPI002FE3C4F8
MSTRNPLTLYKLAKQSLLKSETILSTALQDLSTLMYHDIFMDAFMGEHNEVLKVMVQAWPFPYLPLRTLMDLRNSKSTHTQFGEITPQQKNLQSLEALLDGIDTQLSQKFQHRWNLQVLDWRDVHREFWTLGPTAMSAAHLTDARNKKKGKPCLGEKQPMLRIFTHLCFEYWSSSCATHDKLQLCLLKWASKRKASVRLYCEKVTIRSSDILKILKLLRTVHLDSIHELHVFSDWNQKTMKAFVSQLKKMTNLHTFHFRCLSTEEFPSPSKNKWYSRLYASHLGQMQSLQELHMEEVFFLRGALHKILRTQTPLKALSLSSSPLKESDLKHLSQCASTSQFKSLTLSWISMHSFHPDTLRVLIHNLASTLETLALEHCEFTDTQLLAILPALSSCSRLRTFSCCGNYFSLSTHEVLLCLTLRMSQ